MRTTKNISITMPPTMLKEAENTAKEEGRTISELLREALRHYLETRQWQMGWTKIRRYGTKNAKVLGLKPKDVNRLIQEYRTEQR